MLSGRALLDEIRSAKDVGQVCSLLVELLGAIRRQIGSGPLRLEEARALAAQVAEIRSLLQELEAFNVDMCKAEQGVSGNYIELEGKIKEIRNDLDRMAK